MEKGQRSKKRTQKRLVLTISCLTSLILLAWFFLQFNLWVFTNYQINSYEKSRDRLVKVNRVLELSFLEKKQSQDIELLARDFHFEKTTQIHYLKVLSGVATK